MVQPFDIQRDHIQLLDEMYALLNPGGTLFFSTNFRKFKMEWAAPMGAENNEISDKTVPFDYRDKKIHRCFEIQKLG
jgi:23S rRNA G2069 N7-methylase RlmK/C1962 C5-methylase RlmI